ncbi:MAG: hypothetical protein ACI4QZ_07250 [Eubacteriales bacterium]
MEMYFDGVKLLIENQANLYRDRNLSPSEIKRRFAFHRSKYHEYVVETNDGSRISHYICKKALEKIAGERGIDLSGEESARKEQGTTDERGTV